MTRSPLHRACMALRLPRGLYCYNARADVPLSDAEIRANLRRQHVATERLVLALADTIAETYESEDPVDVWPAAVAAAQRRDLSPVLCGVLAGLACLIDDGAVEPDEWGFFVEAAP